MYLVESVFSIYGRKILVTPTSAEMTKGYADTLLSFHIFLISRTKFSYFVIFSASVLGRLWVKGTAVSQVLLYSPCRWTLYYYYYCYYYYWIIHIILYVLLWLKYLLLHLLDVLNVTLLSLPYVYCVQLAFILWCVFVLFCNWPTGWGSTWIYLKLIELLLLLLLLL
jgi:hypothetical protein